MATLDPTTAASLRHPPDSRLCLSPPLLNSSSPWATTLSDLQSLYNSPHTGAITTRTSLPRGFLHSDHHHQKLLTLRASFNTYGYSPHPLGYYLTTLSALLSRGPQKKPFIISITGSIEDLESALADISNWKSEASADVWVEINLSCPNISGRPPPAYDAGSLRAYLDALPPNPSFPIGIKAPPYTTTSAISSLVMTLSAFPQIRFLTATNTLGLTLPLASPPSLDADGTRTWQPALSSESGTGAAGMGGEQIHELALGNVDALRRGLDAVGRRDVLVIGVGGVADMEGMERMLAVGAEAVGVATALGREGVGVFAKILGEEEGVEEAEAVEKVRMPPN